MSTEHVPSVWDWHADQPVYCAACRRVNDGDIQMVSWPCEVAVAEQRLAEAARLLTALAEREPVNSSEFEPYCLYCQEFAADFVNLTHADDCPWLAARAWLARQVGEDAATTHGEGR